MNIQVLEPQKFVRFEKLIFIVSGEYSHDTLTLCTHNNESVIVKKSETNSLTDIEIEDALNNTPLVLEQAIEAGYIHIRNQYVNEYLNYCKSYD